MNHVALPKLPAAIWIPTGRSVPAIYRGTPIEMVREMAAEMEVSQVEVAVKRILAGLSENRRVTIRLPSGLPEEALSGLFVHALLATGVGRPMPLV